MTSATPESDSRAGTAMVAEITEEDLKALDTQSVVDEPLRATDPVNAVFLKVATVVCLAVTAVMTTLVTIAVIMRYFFNSSLPIASEGPTYLFPWLIAGGAVAAQAQMGHVAVEALLERLHGRNLKTAYLLIWGFVTVLLAYLTYLGLYMVPPMAQQTTPIMGWPQIGSFAAFIVMVAAMAVQAGARTYYIAKNGVPHHVPTMENPTPTQENIDV